eukprot:CAMPEP_0172182166 /NCGR_PEP_ID=MMETSP1050-20130122/18240_1 /TAXON_ID=233186 /ORGANISM="Cryptomonas curvata, Strain CCAP979/52" /LENGTH=204 /DNA_ID=CAMNT_0012855565 /DNA_START=303 /DNA_END=914 /DNA_ORIENTATION=-
MAEQGRRSTQFNFYSAGTSVENECARTSRQIRINHGVAEALQRVGYSTEGLKPKSLATLLQDKANIHYIVTLCNESEKDLKGDRLLRETLECTNVATGKELMHVHAPIYAASDLLRPGQRGVEDSSRCYFDQLVSQVEEILVSLPDALHRAAILARPSPRFMSSILTASALSTFAAKEFSSLLGAWLDDDAGRERGLLVFSGSA